MADYHVLHAGYSQQLDNGIMRANATCTLIVTPNNNIIVDTMTVWDAEIIKTKLRELNIDKIDYVVSTHCHPDHVGNNHLFLNAKHIVGYSVFEHDKFVQHPFDKGVPFTIDEYSRVIPTPGHTLEDVTLLVKTKENKIVACAGDLFEREEDIFEDPSLWLDNSHDVRLQADNRCRVLEAADLVIPGHGELFQVSEGHRQAARVFLNNLN